MSFSDGDSSGDDDEPEPRGKRGRDDPMAAFASAKDYQHLIGDNVPNQGRSSANKKKRTKL